MEEVRCKGVGTIPLFQAKRTHPVNKDEDSIFINAPDRTSAIAALRKHGWASAEWLDHVPPGSDVPNDATVLDADRAIASRRAPARIAESWIIQRPILTIAYGVVLGWIFISIIKLVIGLLGMLFAAMFLN